MRYSLHIIVNIDFPSNNIILFNLVQWQHRALGCQLPRRELVEDYVNCMKSVPQISITCVISICDKHYYIYSRRCYIYAACDRQANLRECTITIINIEFEIPIYYENISWFMEIIKIPSQLRSYRNVLLRAT